MGSLGMVGSCYGVKDFVYLMVQFGTCLLERHMKHNMHKFTDKCLVCKKAISRVMPHGLSTTFSVPEHP